MPFAVVGSNTLLEVNGKRVRGRLYPWGVVEVENKDHCDFIKLRNMLIRLVESIPHKCCYLNNVIYSIPLVLL